jgi:hypothetical protein
MKNIILTSFILLSNFLFSQEMKIKWQDNDGREFNIIAPTGELSYGMLSNDRISYDYNGRVSKIGSVYVSYDYNGRISKVGSVYISFDYNGRLSKVGGMYVKYDYQGRVTGTSGEVN